MMQVMQAMHQNSYLPVHLDQLWACVRQMMHHTQAQPTTRNPAMLVFLLPRTSPMAQKVDRTAGGTQVVGLQKSNHREPLKKTHQLHCY